MKIHGKWITVLGVGLVISMGSHSVYAQSINRMTRVVTVGENTLLQTENNHDNMPVLVITLEDELSAGSRFYLNLEHATWEEKVDVYVEGVEETVVKAKPINKTELEVIVEAGKLPSGAVLRIPMTTEVTKGEAKVTIDHNNTSLSPQTLVFANTSAEKGSIRIDKIPKVVEGGVIAPITLEEAYPNQFNNDRAKEAGSVMTLTIEQSGYEWDEKALERVSLTGIKSFENIKGDKTLFRKVDAQTLEMRLPAAIYQESRSGRGGLTLTGLELKATDKAPTGNVNVALSGSMIDSGVYTVLECADYEVKLQAKAPTKGLTGDVVTVGFTLEENMPGALLKDRSLDVCVSDGELLLNQEGNVVVKIGDVDYTYPPIMEGSKCIGFEVNNLGEGSLKEQLKYDMKLQVKLPVAMNQAMLQVRVEGRGLPEQKALVRDVIEVHPKVTLEAEPIILQDGKREQMGGRITLTETQSGSLKEDGVIFLEFLDDEMSIAKQPVMEVVSGDIKLGQIKEVPGGFEIPVERASKTPSQIEIKHFGFHTTGAISDGYYELGIGGNALTDFENERLIIPDWIMVNVAPKNVRKVTFRLGEEAYNLNGKYYHVEVPPYLEAGRVMVPLKYVVESLGIKADQVKWDKASQKITIYAEHVIELELDSTIMKVDGQKVYMPVATKNKQGYTMVPMSELAKALEVDVTWDEKLQTATFVAKL